MNPGFTLVSMPMGLDLQPHATAFGFVGGHHWCSALGPLITGYAGTLWQHFLIRRLGNSRQFFRCAGNFLKHLQKVLQPFAGNHHGIETAVGFFRNADEATARIFLEHDKEAFALDLDLACFNGVFAQGRTGSLRPHPIIRRLLALVVGLALKGLIRWPMAFV